MALKIIFMGTSEFSVPSLRLLNLKYEVVSVYTQPPKKKNRGQKTLNSPIHEYAKKLKISVRNPISLNQNEEIEYIKN